MKRPDTIFHIHFKETDTHEYYGSLAAIFTAHKPREIGDSLDTLYRSNITQEHPFSNRICTIYKGKIVRKATNRKPPVKILRVY